MIFTFGFGHVCPCGLSLRECYVEIEGDYDTARAAMVERYGVKWAFQYETLEDAIGGPPRTTVPFVELRRVEPNEACGCGGLGRLPWEPELPPERVAELERLVFGRAVSVSGTDTEGEAFECAACGCRSVVYRPGVSEPLCLRCTVEPPAEPDSSATLNNLARGVDEVTREQLGKSLVLLVVGTAADGFLVASTLEQVDFARELRALLERVEGEIGYVGGPPHTA